MSHTLDSPIVSAILFVIKSKEKEIVLYSLKENVDYPHDDNSIQVYTRIV